MNLKKNFKILKNLRMNKKILFLHKGGIKKNYSSIKEIFRKKLKKFEEE
jgi:UV DNA damage repair endonuclease